MQPNARNIRALSASLLPLRMFNPNAQLMAEITETYIKQLEDVFVQIDHLEEDLANCFNSKVAGMLPHMRKIIGDVQDMVGMFHLKFRTKVRHALQKIRSKHCGEDVLLEITEWRDQSPCNWNTLAAWIRDKESDIHRSPGPPGTLIDSSRHPVTVGQNDSEHWPP